MAANINDKLRKSFSFLQKTLSGGIDDNDTELTPNNVTSIPTDTAVSFVVDRIDSNGARTPTKRELMTGIVAGGTISQLLRGEQNTTAQSHLGNAVIEFVLSGEMWNDMCDFLLMDHANPYGYHKTLHDTNGAEWIKQSATASAVNEVEIANAATGNAPVYGVSGDDTNINAYMRGKGSGIAHAENSEILPNHVASGGVVALSSGLIGSFSNIVYYISGRRYSASSIANKTYTASKDTYVDINSSGTPLYSEVTNGAASPALTAGYIRIAKVVTSGAAITSVTRSGLDSLNNAIYPQNISAQTLTHLRYEAVAVSNIANNAVLSYTSKIYDSRGEWDTTNKRFTATVPGLYQVIARAWWGSAGAGTTEYAEVYIRKNTSSIAGSDRTRGSGDSNTLIRPVSIITTYLEIGDQIDAIITCTNAVRDLVAGSHSFIEIHRVG